MVYAVKYLYDFEASDDLGNGDFSVLVRIADDYADLVARVAELEKDAARYRWLRNLPVGHDDEWIANLTGDHLDSAIDETMSREA